MSSALETKVISMQFDNSDFERNVKESLNTIQELRNGLRLENVETGFNELNNSIKRVSFNPLVDGLDVVMTKTLAVHYAVKRMIENITDDITRYLRNVGNELFVNPWRTGFQEYEQKINAVQTIMAGSKEDLNTVNRYLSELNAYADKTIYSFSDMTQNIGKFTNAGVSLKDAVAAIQGVANVAAISGANTNEASRAMYNFAQALSAGHVKLIDWKSIENANMATKEFKEELIKTAVALGTVKESTDGMYLANGKAFNATKNFNDVLQQQWMTTDVLVQTLARYTDETTDIGQRAMAAAQEVKTLTQLMDTLKEAAQSTWTETWEIIIGDFNEAKELYTDISQAIGGFIDKLGKERNDFLSDVLDSNYKKFNKNMAEAGLSMENFFENVRDASVQSGLISQEAADGMKDLNDIIKSGAVPADYLYTMYKNFLEVRQDLTDEELRAEGYTEDNIKKIRALWEETQNANSEMRKIIRYIDEIGGRQMIIDTIKKSFQLLGDLLRPIGEAFKTVFPGLEAEKVKKAIKKIYDYFQKLKPSEKFLSNVKTTFEGIFSIVALIGHALKTVLYPLGVFAFNLAKILGRVIEHIFSFTAALAKPIKEFVDEFRKTSVLRNTLIKWVNEFTNYLRKLGKDVLDFFRTMDLDKFLADMSKNLTDFGKWISDIFDTIIKHIPSLEVIQNGFESFFNTVVEGFKNLTGIDLKDLPNEISNFINNLNIQLPSLESISKKIKEKFQYFFGKRYLYGGDELVEIPSRFEEFIDKIKKNLPSLDEIKKSIIKFFTEKKDLITNSNFFKELPENLSKFWEETKKRFKELKGRIQNDLRNLFENLFSGENPFNFNIDLSGMFDNLKNFKDSILGFFTGTDWAKLLNNVENSLKNIQKFLGINNIQDILKLIKDFSLINLFGSSSNFLKDISSPNSNFLQRITNFLNDAFGIGEKNSGFKQIADSISETLGTVRKALEAYQRTLDAKKLTGLAVAIGVMALALIALSFIDKEKLSDSLKFLSAILGEILIAMFVFSKLGKTDISVARNIGFLVGLGASLLLFTSVIKKLGTMNPDELKQGLAGLAAMITELALLILALQFISKKIGNDADLLKIMGSFIILGIAIKILSGSIKTIGEMDTRTLIQGLVGMFAVFELLTIFIGQLEIISKHIGKSQNLIGIGFGMILIAASLKIFASSISDLGSIEIPTLLTGLVVIGILFTAVSLLTRFMKGNTIVQGVGLLLISASLYVFAGAIMAFAAIPAKMIKKGLISIAVGLGILAAFCWAVSGVILPVAFGMLTLSASVLIFGLGLGAIGAGLLALAAAMAIFALVGPPAAKAFVKSFKIMLEGLIRLLPNIGIFAAKAIVSLIDGLVDSADSISEAIGRFLDIAIKFIKDNSARLVKLIFEPLIAILDEGIVYVPKFVDKLVDFIVLCLDSLTEKIPVLIPSITNFVKALFNELIKAFEGADFSSMIDGAKVFGIVAGLAIGLAFVSKFIPLAMKGAVGVGLLMAEIAGIIAAIGAMSKIPGFNDFLNSGGDILLKLGDIIGGFFGNIIGKTIENTASKLPKTGEYLSEFMDNLKPFIEGAKKLEEAGPGINVLMDLITKMTAANLIEGLTSLFTGEKTSLKDFGKALVEFGPYIVEFSNIISGNIDEAAVESAANLGRLLSEFSNSLDNVGGVADWFTGKKQTLIEFGKELTAFAPYLVKFSNIVSRNPINEEAVTSAVNAGKLMSGFASSLESVGGVADWFTGKKVTLAEFGKDLVAFAPFISRFSEIVSERPINEEAVTSAVNAGKLISGFASSLESVGGVADWFTGKKQTLSEFGKELMIFGPSLCVFSKLIGDTPISEEAIESAVNAAKIMKAFADEMPKQENWWDNIFGGNISLGEFSAELVPFGENMKEFSDSIIGIDVENIDSIVSISKAIKELIEIMPEVKTFMGFETSNPFVDLGENMKKFGERFLDFCNNVSTIDTTTLSKVIAELDKIILTAKSMLGMDTEVITNFGKALEDLGKSGIDGFIKAFEDSYTKVQTTAEDLLSRFIEGLDAKFSDVTNKFGDIAREGVYELNSFYYNFKNAGSYLVEGFANGISEKTFAAQAAATAMAQAAYDAATSVLMIKSPSRLFMKVGAYIPLGLAKGILSKNNVVNKSISEMSNNTIKQASKIISKISDLLDSNMDSEPVIRPIMDLSEIQNGIKSIDSMFSKDQAFTISKGFNAKSRSINDNVNSNDIYNNLSFGDIIIYAENGDVDEIARTLGNSLDRELRIRGYAR